MPMAPKAKSAPKARRVQGASRASARAANTRGMSKMPKMLAGGGLTSQGLRSQRASRTRDDDLESRYGSQEKGYQESIPQQLPSGGTSEKEKELPIGGPMSRPVPRMPSRYRRGGKVSGYK